MADIAIAGGGPVGLFSALLLARSGHQVVLLESDKDPARYSADEVFFGWRRPGVPQSMHGHVFRGRVGRVLREEAPDVSTGCWTVGSKTPGMTSAPDLNTMFLPCRGAQFSRPHFVRSFTRSLVWSSAQVFEWPAWTQPTEPECRASWVSEHAGATAFPRTS